MLDESLLENLDCNWPDVLEAYANRIESTTIDDKADAKTRDLLAKYARTKANSIRMRAGGNIALASRHENSCDLIYASLPSYVKW